MLTTVGNDCGIAAYTRALTGALANSCSVEVVTVPITPGKQSLEHYQEQAAQLNADGIDLVHIQHEFSFWGGVLPRSSAFWQMRYLLKKPVVMTAHTTYGAAEMLRLPTERRPLQRLVKRALMLNKPWVQSVEIAPFVTALTIVHTKAARNAMIERGAKPGFIEVVPTGIPPALPAPHSGREFRRTYGVTDKKVISLFGFIAPNKGYELTLGVLQKLPDDVVLVIAGGPRNDSMRPYADSLSREIEARGIAKRVVVTGYLSDGDAAEVMAASHLVVTPHTQATGSYSVALPLAHGKAIVASNQDCFKEIVERRPCLALFASGDESEFLNTVSALLTDDKRRAELGRQASLYAEATSWVKVAERTVNIYRRALELW